MMGLAPMARSSQGCPCAGEQGWVEAEGGRQGEVRDRTKKQLPSVILKCPSLPRNWPINRVHFKIVGLEQQDFLAY